MHDSTRRHRSRFAKGLWLATVALLLLGTACQNNDSDDPSISVDQDRGANGALEALTVKGEGYTPNGTVLVTKLLVSRGGNAGPYVEQEIQADGSGNFTYERRPMPCPQPADYESGSFVSVSARDMATGKSSAPSALDPGRDPDCRR